MATGTRGGPGIKNRNISATAGIRPYKHDLVYASESAFNTAKADAGLSGSAVEGDYFYDSTANVLKYYDGTSWVAVGDAGFLQRTVVTATTADLAAMHTGGTEIVLVAAPTDGSYNIFCGCLVQVLTTTTPLTGGGNVTVELDGGTEVVVSAAAAASDTFASSADVACWIPPLATDVAPLADQELQLTAASAFTDGGSATTTARITTFYRNVPAS